jgi:hypothetical protein
MFANNPKQNQNKRNKKKNCLKITKPNRWAKPVRVVFYLKQVPESPRVARGHLLLAVSLSRRPPGATQQRHEAPPFLSSLSLAALPLSP